LAVSIQGQGGGEVLRKLTKSIRRGVGKADKDWGMRLLDNNGIRAILADINNNDWAFCGDQLEGREWYRL
jgi:hypothetical protein